MGGGCRSVLATLPGPAACSLTCGGPPDPGLSGLLPPILGRGKALGGGAGWRQEGRAGSQGYSSPAPGPALQPEGWSVFRLPAVAHVQGGAPTPLDGHLGTL